MKDAEWMAIAIEEAELAAAAGEVPVGAVLVQGDRLLARAHNLRETERMATAHAELLAIEEGCRQLGGWRLSGCTLYVTLEPCPMCAGAIVNSRLPRLVYGARDPRAGAYGSLLNLNAYPLNHHVEVSAGICEDECLALLRRFFAVRRGNVGE
ncbi:MAG: tRNA adenosine(34) deaminase TadA [Clostridia bacterium]|nr:tRNA adenosine(34) deaminase TadA [Clostridia bacterium]